MVDAVGVDLEGRRRISPGCEPYGETNRGLRREGNEDALLLGDYLPIPTFAVADGVGGEEHGEIASRTVVSLLRSIAGRGEEIDQEDIFYINSRIHRGFTTLVVAQEIVSNHFRIFSVGDSSALLLDANIKTLQELTPRDEDRQGKLTQALGKLGGRAVSPHAIDVTLAPGQKLILATDGFTRYLDRGKISPANVLVVNQSSASNRQFVQELIKMANVCGGSDNITIVSIPYKPAG